ncbi:hypothetical protein Cpa01nite_34930 [Cellulomonas pakistanensis]|uniref:Uncharacterized protein n=1 Tax=Cellulomonas pakistanensis TaxID=992287 RepID=A0A919U8N8_9CELL|nr:hypothetical protein Cpa01nite_34930 [Cellulomonas pakistanensis]
MAPDGMTRPAQVALVDVTCRGTGGPPVPGAVVGNDTSGWKGSPPPGPRRAHSPARPSHAPQRPPPPVAARDPAAENAFTPMEQAPEVPGLSEGWTISPGNGSRAVGNSPRESDI